MRRRVARRCGRFGFGGGPKVREDIRCSGSVRLQQAVTEQGPLLGSWNRVCLEWEWDTNTMCIGYVPHTETEKLQKIFFHNLPIFPYLHLVSDTLAKMHVKKVKRESR